MDFDPEVISYEDLLGMFWSSHDPVRLAPKTQYASLILAHDDEQLAAATESARRLRSVLGRPLSTRIERLDRFHLAEDYHQKYYLQNDGVVVRDFREMYPRVADLTDSTAAMRVNGYLYGAGGCARLHPELSALGLSPEAEDRLRSVCR